MAAKNGGPLIEREAHLEWVLISTMRVTEEGQRRLNWNRINKLVKEMKLEDLGYPTVNARDGHHWIVDGQHRVKALVEWDPSLENSKIECWVYDGLSEEEEAEKFLIHNDYLGVVGYDKFRIAVKAGRKAEVEISEIVDRLGLRISRQNVPGGIRATGTLKRIHERAGGAVLEQALTVCRDAYGDGELPAMMMDAVALVVGSYGNVNLDHLTRKLARFQGGAMALISRAEVLRQRTGKRKTQCLAAEIVNIYNQGSRHPAGGRLTPWWKAEAYTEREEATA